MVLVPAVEVIDAIVVAVASTFGPKRPYPLDRRSAAVILACLLVQFPNEGAGSRHELSDETIVETQALFIERVMLAPDGARPPRRTPRA